MGVNFYEFTPTLALPLLGEGIFRMNKKLINEART